MTMNNKPNYYAIIPANVRYCKTIPMGSKLLYGEITALSNEKGYCWAKNSYFEELYQVDKKTIIRWLNKLIEQKFIKKIKVDNTEYQRCLTIINNGGTKNVTPTTKNVTNGETKMSPSNITKNITDKKIKRYNDKMINNHDITNYLIDINFISSYELNIEDYNELFNDYEEQIGNRELKKCVSYILNKAKHTQIENKLKYIKQSIKDYIPRLELEEYS